MGKLRSWSRRLGAALALVLAFAPAALQAGGALAPNDGPSSAAAREQPTAVERLPWHEDHDHADDDVPGWVWGVVGGTSGAAILAALGYGVWLRRRR